MRNVAFRWTYNSPSIPTLGAEPTCHAPDLAKGVPDETGPAPTRSVSRATGLTFGQTLWRTGAFHRVARCVRVPLCHGWSRGVRLRSKRRLEKALRASQ